VPGDNVNAKLAKKLRRDARRMGADLADRAYLAREHEKTVVFVNKYGDRRPFKVRRFEARLADCGKGTYRQLKKLASPA
jgi:hypothetical protein